LLARTINRSDLVPKKLTVRHISIIRKTRDTVIQLRSAVRSWTDKVNVPHCDITTLSLDVG
jgi:hypothetical protein